MKRLFIISLLVAVNPLILLIFMIFISTCRLASPSAATALNKLPNRVLWAWQRPEDLSTIDPHEFAVAYLGCHILLTAQTVKYHWRDQPLKVPNGTMMVPVVRIDIDRKHQPSFSEDQITAIVAAAKKLASQHATASLQIDFDALASERKFYAQLLKRLRASLSSLPAPVPISITALASWCLFDNWIEGLPVDETVPMMFSLGKERKKILLYFASHEDFRVPGCTRCLGLSLEDQEVNELMIPLARRRKMSVRIYVFSNGAWSDKKIQAVRTLLSGL